MICLDLKAVSNVERRVTSHASVQMLAQEVMVAGAVVTKKVITT